MKKLCSVLNSSFLRFFRGVFLAQPQPEIDIDLKSGEVISTNIKTKRSVESKEDFSKNNLPAQRIVTLYGRGSKAGNGFTSRSFSSSFNSN